jgi:hypothetical protein
MSSDELSLAEDSQDELLSNANDDTPQNGEAEDTMGDLFGDDSDQEPAPYVKRLTCSEPSNIF